MRRILRVESVGFSLPADHMDRPEFEYMVVLREPGVEKVLIVRCDHATFCRALDSMRPVVTDTRRRGLTLGFMMRVSATLTAEYVGLTYDHDTGLLVLPEASGTPETPEEAP